MCIVRGIPACRDFLSSPWWSRYPQVRGKIWSCHLSEPSECMRWHWKAESWATANGHWLYVLVSGIPQGVSLGQPIIPSQIQQTFMECLLHMALLLSSSFSGTQILIVPLPSLPPFSGSLLPSGQSPNCAQTIKALWFCLFPRLQPHRYHFLTGLRGTTLSEGLSPSFVLFSLPQSSQQLSTQWNPTHPSRLILNVTFLGKGSLTPSQPN